MVLFQSFPKALRQEELLATEDSDEDENPVEYTFDFEIDEKKQLTSITELKIVIQMKFSNLKLLLSNSKSIAKWLELCGQITVVKIIFDEHFDTYFRLEKQEAISFWEMMLCGGFEESLEQLCIGSSDCLLNECDNYMFYQTLWLDVLLPNNFYRLFNLEIVPFINVPFQKEFLDDRWMMHLQTFIVQHREKIIERRVNQFFLFLFLNLFFLFKGLCINKAFMALLQGHRYTYTTCKYVYTPKVHTLFNFFFFDSIH
ncbi:hypothetical protein RFI_06485 [Reticulomyxa filosa]|uniref:Uncharacterized protein n=1 Tax=Reticulomyxa filosa TaxID=46433 RepID=X6NWE5_RETFI|nr:hypothetical protein RFI_06485 [Reticulomyxa filosa]|eukprot:ETO30635.1 hypothetical protein RFI_06485 [Reticulomyxa filosa]